MNNIAPRANKFIIEALVGRRAAYDAKIKYTDEQNLIRGDSHLTEYCYIEEIDPLANIIDILEEAGHQNAYALATVPFLKVNMYASKSVMKSITREVGKVQTYNKSQTFLRLALSRYFRVYLSMLKEDTTLARFCLGSSDYWPEYYKYFKEVVAPILVRNNFDPHEFSKVASFTGVESHPDEAIDLDLQALYFMSMYFNDVPVEGHTRYENLTKQQVDHVKNLVVSKGFIYNRENNNLSIEDFLDEISRLTDGLIV